MTCILRGKQSSDTLELHPKSPAQAANQSRHVSQVESHAPWARAPPMQSGSAPEAALPTTDDSDAETLASRHSRANDTAGGGEALAASPAPAAIVPSPSSAHTAATAAAARTPGHDAMARLDEYDSLAQRVLGDAVLDAATAVHRLADHIAAMAERIAHLEAGAAAAGPAEKLDGDSILASAERELQMMEELIRQQDEYIAQLEKAHE